MNRNILNPITGVILLSLLSGLLIFHNLGQGSLWDWDEAIYASVAKEMVKEGDSLSLHLNGHYWPEKPPLVIWCMVAKENELITTEAVSSQANDLKAVNQMQSEFYTKLGEAAAAEKLTLTRTTAFDPDLAQLPKKGQ